VKSIIRRLSERNLLAVCKTLQQRSTQKPVVITRPRLFYTVPFYHQLCFYHAHNHSHPTLCPIL
jgi:hypothetical protein